MTDLSQHSVRFPHRFVLPESASADRRISLPTLINSLFHLGFSAIKINLLMQLRIRPSVVNKVIHNEYVQITIDFL